MNAGGPIIERKRKADGRVAEYACRLVHASSSVVVIRYDMPGGSSGFVTPFTIPPGSSSFGYFWFRRPFNLYRMRDSAGHVLGHRIDAVTAVELTDDAIDYRDLALDWWILADDTLLEEDRDEFDAFVASGRLSHDDEAAATEAARHVYSRYRHIIDDVAVLERRLHLLD